MIKTTMVSLFAGLLSWYLGVVFCFLTAPAWSAPPTPRPLLGADMPGKSHQGALPPLTASQKQLSKVLRADVEHLAVTIGERNVKHYDKLQQSRRWIVEQLTRAGYKVNQYTYRADGHEFANLDCELPGKGPGFVVVGAHYDSAEGAPGANDNASGVAALLALARHMASQPRSTRGLRFVAFTNEEPDYFMSPNMGSLVYARMCQKRGDKFTAMLSLETMGYYSDKPKTQKYPFPLALSYPSTGNFLGFVGDIESGPLVKSCVASFRRHAAFPSEGAALPGALKGVDWSDHWSFWQIRVPAVMVTDTAPFRYNDYHLKSDTPDKMDFERMARAVEGLQGVLSDLTR